MANRNSNWPAAQQPDVEPGEMAVMVKKMDELRCMSRPVTDSEVEERVKWFFQWCVDNDVRPGVELLALSLGTTRQTLWNWQQEGGRKGDIITQAKQMLAALVECWGQSGKLNPATFCFLMKNHFSYRDSVEVEAVQRTEPKRTIEQIAAERAERSRLHEEVLEMPTADF